MKNDVPKYKTLTYVIFVSHLCALKRFYFWLDPDNFLSFVGNNLCDLCGVQQKPPQLLYQDHDALLC